MRGSCCSGWPPFSGCLSTSPLAEEAARYLQNSLHLVFPHGSHGDGPFRPCIEDIVAAFYRTGTVEELDTSCVSNARPTPFLVR
jgi:hypothetical protein